MTAQQDAHNILDDDRNREDSEQTTPANQVRERDAAFATLKAISASTGKTVDEIIEQLQRLMQA